MKFQLKGALLACLALVACGAPPDPDLEGATAGQEAQLPEVRYYMIADA